MKMLPEIMLMSELCSFTFSLYIYILWIGGQGWESLGGADLIRMSESLLDVFFTLIPSRKNVQILFCISLQFIIIFKTLC